LALLAAAGLDDPAAALRGLLAVAPVDLAAFLRDRGLGTEAGQRLVAAAGGTMLGPQAVAAAQLAALQAGAQTALAAFHGENPDLVGLGREKLRLILRPRLAKEAFLAFLRAEAEAGHLVLEGAFLRLPDHEVRLSVEDEALWARVAPALTGADRFRPPRVRDFAAALGAEEADLRRVLRMCARLGRVDQIAQDHFFARQVTAEMVGLLVEIEAGAPEGWITAALFRDRVQNGRKVAIQILEYFDRLGVTLRRGDLRRINPHRRDLFEPEPGLAAAPEAVAAGMG
uniref:SelB domain-containing protein n=1 Tax=Xinfangfangia pollutisoli TaxID=2865960 RepID=UPI001CD4A35C